MTGAIIVMLAAAFLAIAAVHTYEKLLRQVTAERDEAVADCELFSELLLEDARAQAARRHPSQRQLRVVR